MSYRMIVHALDALGNPLRREILRNLRAAPLTAGELADRFPVSRPAISRHLRVLTQGGLVEVRAQGQRRCYRIRMHGMAPVRAFVDEFWDTALERLAEIARP